MCTHLNIFNNCVVVNWSVINLGNTLKIKNILTKIEITNKFIYINTFKLENNNETFTILSSEMSTFEPESDFWSAD